MDVEHKKKYIVDCVMRWMIFTTDIFLALSIF